MASRGTVKKPETNRSLRIVYISMQALEDERLSGVSLLVMLALAKHANTDRYGYPSIKTLARIARCSEATARRATKELQSIGYLTIESRYKNDTKGRTSNGYYLNDNPSADADKKAPPCHENTHPPVSGDTTPPVTTDRGTITNRTITNEHKTSAIAVEEQTVPIPEKPNRLKDEVANMFEDFFWEVNGQPASFGRERKSCNRLAVVCRARFPDHPMDFATAIVEEYNAAIEAHEKFWDEQPRSASGLLAHFDRVVSRLRERDRRRSVDLELMENKF